MSMTLVAILGLGVAGNAITSSWTPAAFAPAAAFTDIPPAPPVATPQPVGTVEREDVNVRVDGETLDGWVYAPAAAGRHPGVVFIHGAGTKHRDGFDEQASYLASAGVVSLVLDKRSVGYSTWQRDYEAMAADTLAGVDLLRRRDDVDPSSIGLLGESEGTWIAPVAAAQDPSIAFLIMVSAPIVSPAEQGTYATLTAFDGLDVPDPADRAVAKGIGMAITLPFLLDYADFDVLPWLRQVSQPMLMVYGTDDPAVPLIQGPQLARQNSAGPVTVRYFGDAQHGIRLTTSDSPFAPGYLETLASWITDQAADRGTSLPAISGAQPVQPLSAEGVPPPPWYATGYTHLVVLGLAIVGYLAGPAAALVTKIRRGAVAARMDPARRRSLRRLRLLGLASLGSLVSYFAGLSHLALNQLTNPALTYGVWAIVWIITAGAVMALLNLWLSGTWQRGAEPVLLGGAAGRSAGGRLNAVESVAMVGAVTGTVLLLLVVTYWGVFLGI